MPKTIGVILMTYGSPKGLEGVPEYLTNIYHGKSPDEELVKEFQRRYTLIGGSPLIEITEKQAQETEKLLNSQSNDKYVVKAAMRFSDPFIDDVISGLLKECDEIVGIIMSPQYSPIIMKGYIDTVENALKGKGVKYNVSKSWHTNENFINAIAERVNETLEEYPEEIRGDVPILFSAHSMPKRVIEKEPGYINELHETAAMLAKKLNLENGRWSFCYQSAGHTPEEWLKPDFADIMPELQKIGKKHVLIAPVQFLADHLETLYDIEIAAREQAEIYGIEFKRTKSLNTIPSFIKALSEVTIKTREEA